MHRESAGLKAWDLQVLLRAEVTALSFFLWCCRSYVCHFRTKLDPFVNNFSAFVNFFWFKKKKILSVGGKTICQAGKDCN